MKNSVSAHGPNTSENLGLVMLSLAEPLLAGEIAVDVEIGAVVAQAGDDAQPVGDLQLLLDEEAESQALHGILADRVVRARDRR